MHIEKCKQIIICKWVLVLFLFLSAIQAEVYNVTTDEELAAVPWLTLQAGDQVRINWKNDHYRVKIGIRSRGTADAPIRITGISGPNGEQPVLDASEAVTPVQFANYNNGEGFFNQYTEGLSGFFIFRGSLDSYEYKSGYLIIENLRITGCNEGNYFTNQAGVRELYWNGASGLWALTEHLIVRHCQIDDNGNGFFTQSTYDEAHITRDVLFEYNRVFNNGNAWNAARNDREHNIYTQAGTSMVFQYNNIGRVRSGTGGSSLKDRSGNLVIRYNQIEASARALDLVEAEDSYDILSSEPGYHETYVYGNCIIDDIDSTPHATSLIHFGADNMAEPARMGPHHFYNNTVVVTGTGARTEWRICLFDCGTGNSGDQAINNQIELDIRNNILYRNPLVITNGGQMGLMRYFGKANLNGTNWISSGWQNGRDGFVGTVYTNGTLIEGTDPGFVNESRRDFTLQKSSSAIDKAEPLPSGISSLYPIMNMYKPDADSALRVQVGTGMDLGAYEFTDASVGNRLLIGNSSVKSQKVSKVIYSLNGRNLKNNAPVSTQMMIRTKPLVYWCR